MPRHLAHLSASLLALLLVSSLALSITPPAVAQEPASDVTEIEFVTIEGSPGPLFFSGGAVTLRVAGEVCLTHEFTGDDLNPVVRLGGPDQPAVCSAAGEYIRTYRADGRLLATKLRVSPGARIQFINWIEWPGPSDSGVGIAMDRPITSALMVLSDGTPCAVVRFGPDDPDEADIGGCGSGEPLRFITAEGRYLEQTAERRFDHPIIIRDATTIDPAREAPPGELLALMNDLLACIDTQDPGEGSPVVIFDRDGRVPACGRPALATATLTFDVPNKELIPGAVTVLANDTVCFVLGLPEVGQRSIVLGQVGQPVACGTDGARLTFVDGHGRELSFHATHEDGVDQLVANWAPLPPHDELNPRVSRLGTYLENITRCYRLFEGGTGTPVLLLPVSGRLPPCPVSLYENLASPAPTQHAQVEAPTAPSDPTTALASATEPAAPRTDTTDTTRNVAAAVVVSVVLALVAAAVVEVVARRRGRTS